MKHYIFYKTTYTKNGKFYYGSHHGSLNDNYRGSNKVIKSIQKKTGNKFLKRDNLRFFATKDEMLKFEDRFLKLYDLANNKMAYNFKNSANGGDTWSQMDVDEKIKRKKLLSSKISGKQNGNYGKELSEEIKNKIRISKIGVPIHTEEHKKNTSIRIKKEWDSGKRKISEKFKAASNNRKGKKNTTETRLKISMMLKNSEKHKKGRLLAAITRREKYIKRLIQFKGLLKENKTKEEIMLELNIKKPTFNKYKQDYKKLI